MLARLGVHEAHTASGSDVELAAFLEKEAEEADPKKRKKAQKQKKKANDDLPKLFMELKWSEQRKIGAKAPVLRQVEGDSINQRIRLYRRTIFFHIHCVVRALLYEETTIDDPDVRVASSTIDKATVRLIFMSSQLDMRWTPLHYAVMGGHEKIVERLDHAGVAKLLLRKKAFIDETDVRARKELGSITHLCKLTIELPLCSERWLECTTLWCVAFIICSHLDRSHRSLDALAAANDAALAADVLVQYDISLKTRTESTSETALEMAERLRSHLVAILLYEVTYRKPQQVA
ncbi:unnamed protein product [Phytophthora fragariaefolia]|uniref:Unnamed protein product n=1 Tax=Phytophthora fragariaefolia TaxID=1490495 RepID=A0A9W6XJF9_9STRA|nr:unnamed protein product [Phytophthora fragariaefolia]